MSTTSIADDAAGGDANPSRTYRLGGQTRTRGVLRGRSRAQLGLLVAAVAGAALLLLMIRSIWLLAGFALVALLGTLMSRHRTLEGEPWSGWVLEWARARAARYSGADRYAPDAARPVRPVPAELGRVEFTAAEAGDGSRLAVTEHPAAAGAGAYLSVVIELRGGGEGLRDQAARDRDAARFGRLTYGLSAPALPVDQVDLTTRVQPLTAEDFRAWARAHSDPDAPAAARDNLLELADTVAAPGDQQHRRWLAQYDTWLVVRMSRAALADRLGVSGQQASPETIARAAFDTAGQVATAAEDAGFTVVRGLGPARLGALIRHLYDPSWGLHDDQGLTGPRDAWRPYQAQLRGLQVPSADGGAWWHATASVPQDGWPQDELGTRWLAPLVTDRAGPDGQPVVRTVTSQFRFLPRRAAQRQAQAGLTLDRADMIKQHRKGQVSTGETEAQAGAAERVLADVLGQAAGCQPALRITASARSRAGLTAARERVDEAALSTGIHRLSWHDGRHHHAHLLTLPLARGIAKGC